MDSFRNFSYVRSYLHLNSFAWNEIIQLVNPNLGGLFRSSFCDGGGGEGEEWPPLFKAC